MMHNLVKFGSLWIGALLTTKASRKEPYENESNILANISVSRKLFRVKGSDFQILRTSDTYSCLLACVSHAHRIVGDTQS